jgi:hypothetical protein
MATTVAFFYYYLNIGNIKSMLPGDALLIIWRT